MQRDARATAVCMEKNIQVIVNKKQINVKDFIFDHKTPYGVAILSENIGIETGHLGLLKNICFKSYKIMNI